MFLTASTKVRRLAHTEQSATIVTHISTEMRLHLEYCAGFGITKDEVEAAEEDHVSIGYSRYVASSRIL
jgi:thiaminase